MKQRKKSNRVKPAGAFKTSNKIINGLCLDYINDMIKSAKDSAQELSAKIVLRKYKSGARSASWYHSVLKSKGINSDLYLTDTQIILSKKDALLLSRYFSTNKPNSDQLEAFINLKEALK